MNIFLAQWANEKGPTPESEAVTYNVKHSTFF
jgi:hypothetical protein